MNESTAIRIVAIQMLHATTSTLAYMENHITTEMTVSLALVLIAI